MENLMKKQNYKDEIVQGGIIIEDTFYPEKMFYSAALRIVLTTDCNFKCIYCYREGETNSEHRMAKLKDLIQILEVAKKIGIRNIKLTGGEPLCYPELEPLLRYLAESNFYCDITSNASLLSINNIRMLNRYNIRSLNISLDSMDKERYFMLTKYNNLDLALINIKQALVTFLGKIRINSIVFDDVSSLKDYYNIIRFCLNNNIELRLLEPTQVNNSPITVKKRNFSCLLDELKKKSSRIIVSESKNLEYIYFEDKYVTALHSMCDNSLCNACKNYLYLRVTSDLKFKPCLIREDNEITINMSTRNEIEQSFIQVLNNWIKFSKIQ